MSDTPSKDFPFDPSSPSSIFEYSRLLIGNTLHELLGDEVLANLRKGKGGLGQMVEELFFGYDVNSNRDADFKNANLELKCTPLLKSKNESSYRIKERLVCTMIDYFELANTRFEDSHLISKCRLMLLLFYLHIADTPIYDYRFLFRVLWKLPEKDLLLIKKDYDTIAGKVRDGQAHLISEGDTLYLGACRKGQRGDSPQSQPFSNIKANKRAFSLKPAYMRYILDHVIKSGQSHFSNYSQFEEPEFELVSSSEIKVKSFEDIIMERFQDYIGLDYIQICDKLGITPYQAKSKYADVCGLIASTGISKRLNSSEEFTKSGLIMKTIRLRDNGMPKESMSFKNIDYNEIFENDDWLGSEAYEMFTNRFMFVVFKSVQDGRIDIKNHAKDRIESEKSYILDNVFFWTMPPEDLQQAEKYWKHIRDNVLSDNIRLDAFWSIADNKNFHVRPKASKKTQLTDNPNGGKCEKFSYWMNAGYIKQITDSNRNNV